MPGMFAMRFRLLIATLWVGSLWAIGYIVAPTLFASLNDQVLAGTIAGRLFHIEAWLSVCCAILLIVMLLPIHRDNDGKVRLLRLIMMMLVCTIAGYFVLHPFMADLRASMRVGNAMVSAARNQFMMLHGLSSLFYLIESVLGAVLILKIR
jgi:hypothetical protein